jgi:hypothetical protein
LDAQENQPRHVSAGGLVVTKPLTVKILPCETGFFRWNKRR